jgi:ubiquinone/menaquinone biosynthesis C-methylase UbiE/DNA-binding response OmpR family regulator
MTQTETGTQVRTGKPVVLLVDDDLSYLEKLQRAFREQYAVHTATSGIEAIKLIKALPEVNALIVNEDLPRMKGTELFRLLNEMFGKSDSFVKVLLADAPLNGTFAELDSYGRIDMICEKPEDPAEIRRKVGFLIAQKSREKRASMRVNLRSLSDIQIEAGGSGEAQVVNLSENGMFLKTMSFFPEGATLPLKISLPDGRRYTVSGRIVRQDIDRGGIGVEYQEIDEQSRHSLLQFLSDYVTARDLTELKLRYPFLKTDEMVLFSDALKIESLMQEALDKHVETVAIHAHLKNPEILQLAEVAPPAMCTLAGEELNVKFKTSDLVFVSFQIGYATYNFETMVSKITPDGKRLVCLYPRVMFYSEKRVARRFSALGGLQLEIAIPAPFNGTVQGRITDISPEGVSFICDQESPLLLPGTPLKSLRILENGVCLWEEKGEVRNVSRADGEAGRRYRYGIQFGIGRMSIQTTRAPEPALASSAEGLGADTKLSPINGRGVHFSEIAHRPPEVVRLENRRGEEIVGLLNYSLPLDDKPIPVVVIPPAFGKTKETLFGLALTIIENFYLLGKPVAVLRYDGIRQKGESYRDAEASEPPYEMLHSSLSQGAEDIKAVLDWLQANPRLRAGPIILISFSLSALEARILLRDPLARRQVDYWIACMGTLEFRHLMNRVNCGLDLLEQYQIGIDLGVIPILGNLITMKPYAADVVANSVATLDQAREDMRHLDLPITWIYGKHDHWIKYEFVRDVMSIQANAPREVISMSIGHNARTSEEALRLFGLLASLIHRHIYKEMIQPILPSKSDMEILRRAEKDRLPARKLTNRKSYWQRYLIGEGNLMGFDIMAMSDDYRQLMQDQLMALGLQASDRLLDLGGGTGNFVEHLRENGRELPALITIADLVPEAMKHADRKLGGRPAGLQISDRISFLCLDLELSRFLPVQRFLSGEIGTFLELADKIENLGLESAEKIQKAYSPRLHRILRGEPITPALEYWLQSQFDVPEYRIITDFYLAARFVSKKGPWKPFFRKLAFPGGSETALHLPLKPGVYNKILMSLVLSYVFNPVETLREIRRIICPGGRLVLSSMRPDTDASGLFTRVLDKIEAMPAGQMPPEWPRSLLLDSLRSFLNDAQALVDLEEAGTFDFFDPEKLEGLLEEAGWENVRTIPSFGDPPQGYVVVAKVRDTHA